MTDPKKPTPVAAECQAQRRKLIKAAAGLPAMMTLASGAANAITSNETCAQSPKNLLTQGDTSYNTSPVAGGPASYDCITITTSNPDPVTNLQTPPSGWPSASPANTYYDTGPYTPIREFVNYTTVDGTDKACVIYVYQSSTTGQLVATYDGKDTKSTSLPVAASCYASFATTINSPPNTLN